MGPQPPLHIQCCDKHCLLSNRFIAPLCKDKHVWGSQAVLFNSLGTPLGDCLSAIMPHVWLLTRSALCPPPGHSRGSVLAHFFWLDYASAAATYLCFLMCKPTKYQHTGATTHTHWCWRKGGARWQKKHRITENSVDVNAMITPKMYPFCCL